MAEQLWKKLERQAVEEFPHFLDDSDECYFARDYVAGGGFNSSEANQLISNFKKTADRKGKPEWRHKLFAIRRFAAELAQLIGRGKLAVTAIPTSKCKSDLLYDDRFEQTLEALSQHCPNITIEWPISRNASKLAVHQGGSRNLTAVYGSLEWEGFENGTPTCLVLVDDVITCGTHFKACQNKVHEYHPRVQVVGAFWARTVWPDTDDD